MRSVLILLASLAALLGFVVAQDDVPMVDKAKLKQRAERIAEAQAAWNKLTDPQKTHVRSWRSALEKELDAGKRAKLYETYEPTILPSTFRSLRFAKDGDGGVVGMLGDGFIAFQIIDETSMIIRLGESETLVWVEGTSTKGIEPDDKIDAKLMAYVKVRKKEYKNLRGGTQRVLHAEVFDPSPCMKFKDIWLK